MVDFLSAIIEFFTIAYGCGVISGNLSNSACFEGGWVTFSANFRRDRALSTIHCGCQETNVIALSYGIKISAVHCLVLSQSTRVTDRQTDRITTGNNALAYKLLAW